MLSASLEALLLGLFNQWLESLRRYSERAAGESVNVGGIHADDFAARIKHRAAAGAVSCGSIVNQFVADDVAEVSASCGRPDKGERGKFAGCTLIIVPEGKARVHRSRRLRHHSQNAHGIADD